MIVAGIMTGTSLDAIDVAICDISLEGDRHAVTLLSFTSAPYPEDVAELIHAALNGTATMEQLSDLPFLLSRAYADALTPFHPSTLPPLTLIGIHGQTLWHHPPISTWQGASGPALSALLNLPVVHDFRSADVALGGQGAPLVPIFDRAVFSSETEDRVALNIGGMANITLLPNNRKTEQPNNRIGNVRAFDTGPGNVLIDAICKRTFGTKYDPNGKFARAGMINQRALEAMMAHPYFAMEPPKSTGREVFNDAMADELYRKYAHPSVPSEDLIATVTELTAWSICDHIRRYQPSTSEVIVSGGGVHNSFLMDRLRTHLPKMRFTSSADHGVDPDAKEAMCFAYLAALTWHGLPGNLPSVTGASRAVVLGSIADVRMSDAGRRTIS